MENPLFWLGLLNYFQAFYSQISSKKIPEFHVMDFQFPVFVKFFLHKHKIFKMFYLNWLIIY